MSNVPDDPVARRVEDVVQRYRELHHAQPGPEMTARDGHGRNGLVTQLVGELTQLVFRHAPQIIRRRNAIKQRSLRGLRHAPSPVMLDLVPRWLSPGATKPAKAFFVQ